MSKIANFLLAAGLTAACALPSVAAAIAPGTYVGNSEEHFYGSVAIVHLNAERSDLGRAPMPAMDMFCYTACDGEEPTKLYVGVLERNEPQQAVGTILYELTNEERTCFFDQSFFKGKWRQPVNAVKGDIVLNLNGDKLSFTAPEDVVVVSSKNYVYAGKELGVNDALAMKVLLCEKVMAHHDAENKPAAHAYAFRNPLDDESREVDLRVSLGGVGEEMDLSINKNWCTMGYYYNMGQAFDTLMEREPAE